MAPIDIISQKQKKYMLLENYREKKNADGIEISVLLWSE